MADLREHCHRCGHSWGITMQPRDRVLCTPCARERAHRDPYVRAMDAIRLLPVPSVLVIPGQRPTPDAIAAVRVALADRYTSLDDLRHALEFARSLPLASDSHPEES